MTLKKLIIIATYLIIAIVAFNYTRLKVLGRFPSKVVEHRYELTDAKHLESDIILIDNTGINPTELERLISKLDSLNPRLIYLDICQPELTTKPNLICNQDSLKSAVIVNKDRTVNCFRTARSFKEYILAKQIAPDKIELLNKRLNESELINFDYSFRKLSAKVLVENFQLNHKLISNPENKIILIGKIGFFTSTPIIDFSEGGLISPLSLQYNSEMNLGDIYPFEASAFVLATILGNNYTNTLSFPLTMLSYLILLIIFYLIVWAISKLKLIYYLTASTLALLIFILVISYVVLILFDSYQLILDMSYIHWLLLAVIVLTCMTKRQKMPAYNIN